MMFENVFKHIKFNYDTMQGQFSSATIGIQNSNGTLGQFTWNKDNPSGHAHNPNRSIPLEAQHHRDILRPATTGSIWRRFILETSQSHWRPTGSAIVDEIGMIDPTWATQASNWNGNGRWGSRLPR